MIATADGPSFDEVERLIQIAEFTRRLQEVWEKNPECTLQELVRHGNQFGTLNDEELMSEIEHYFRKEYEYDI